MIRILNTHFNIQAPSNIKKLLLHGYNLYFMLQHKIEIHIKYCYICLHAYSQLLCSQIELDFKNLWRPTGACLRENRINLKVF